ncbi:MAG: nitrogenase-stabilizing/protective protein NifW [Sulfuritalea sp.]|nr:nitrogenase-stabilizing/protective protein NifW [Sulfuritalea sp.]
MGCEADSFEDDLADLSSAEDFLDYFGIDYEAQVVQVNRLHILQRYHDYLAKQEAGNAPDYQAWRKWLELAYRDFVDSSAQQEKVLAVYRKADGSSFLPLSALTG